MAKLITIGDLSSFEAKDKVLKKGEVLCEELESGNILFFPKIPFCFPQNDIDFLLEQKQTGNSSRKNIAYKPYIDKITNAVSYSKTDQEKMLEIMRNYSYNVKEFLTQLLTPYASSWRLDYASFRPVQEKGRKLRIRARNDLLHTDAFPSRPMHGTRILRFFTNINKTESRKWVTSDSFEPLAQKFAGAKGVPFPKRPRTSAKAKTKRILKRCAGKGWKGREWRGRKLTD